LDSAKRQKQEFTGGSLALRQSGLPKTDPFVGTFGPGARGKHAYNILVYATGRYFSIYEDPSIGARYCQKSHAKIGQLVQGRIFFIIKFISFFSLAL
jgi:hypothetical protein